MFCTFKVGLQLLNDLKMQLEVNPLFPFLNLNQVDWVRLEFVIIMGKYAKFRGLNCRNGLFLY